MHKMNQFAKVCVINCGIEGNASNENITKYKNLGGIKSISNSVQRLARYRIAALISIGRLCICKCLPAYARLFLDAFSANRVFNFAEALSFYLELKMSSTNCLDVIVSWQ